MSDAPHRQNAVGHDRGIVENLQDLFNRAVDLRFPAT